MEEKARDGEKEKRCAPTTQISDINFDEVMLIGQYTITKVNI